MKNRDRFEQDLRQFAAAEHKNEEDVLSAKAIGEALQRLDSSPDIRGGDPEGVFSYEDPILSAAAREYLFPSSPPAFHSRDKAPGSANWLSWAAVGLGILLRRIKYDPDLVEWSAMVPNSVVECPGKTVRLAIVGDAGYCATPQRTVCRMIREVNRVQEFDCIVHLGDIYFAGSPDEMLKGFLEPFCQIGPKVLTLCGNHDLYYGAGAIKSVVKILKQPGRYFAIETPHWRIACLDSSTGCQSLLRNDGYLDEQQLIWLEHLLHLTDSRRSILMSHHFIRSSWGRVSTSFAAQLGPLVKDRVVAWYWGHEHSWVAYRPDGLGFSGACVGNGAFFEEWRGPAAGPSPEWYATGRCKCIRPNDNRFWPHGFLELELQEKQICETYHVEDGAGFTRPILVNTNV